MNAIERLHEELRRKFPPIEAEVDRPDRSGGRWFLDLDLAGRKAAVEWRPERGFGVLAREAALFGDRPDEIYTDLESAIRRIEELLETGIRTQPPEQTVLRKFRESDTLAR